MLGDNALLGCATPRRVDGVRACLPSSRAPIGQCAETDGVTADCLSALFTTHAQGLESLLGGARGGAFDLGGNLWDRKVGVVTWMPLHLVVLLLPCADHSNSPQSAVLQGWAEMDKMREKLPSNQSAN